METGDIAALEVKRMALEREVRREERKAVEAGRWLREAREREVRARRSFAELKADLLTKERITEEPRLALLALDMRMKELHERKRLVLEVSDELRRAKERSRRRLSALGAAKAREERGAEILQAMRRKLMNKQETADAEASDQAARIGAAVRGNKGRKGGSRTHREPTLLSLETLPMGSHFIAGSEAPARAGWQTAAGQQQTAGQFEQPERERTEQGGPAPESRLNQEFADRVKELLSWSDGDESGIKVFYLSASGKAVELEVTKRVSAGGLSITVESAAAPDRALILIEKAAILETLRKSGIRVASFMVRARGS